MNVCMQQQNSRPRGCLNVRVADSFLVNHCCCTWRACCAFMFLLFTPWKQKAAHKVKLPLEIKADICTKTHKIVKVRVQWLRAVVMIIHPIRKCHLSDRWFFVFKTPTQVIQTRALHSLWCSNAHSLFLSKERNFKKQCKAEQTYRRKFVASPSCVVWTSACQHFRQPAYVKSVFQCNSCIFSFSISDEIVYWQTAAVPSVFN